MEEAVLRHSGVEPLSKPRIPLPSKQTVLIALLAGTAYYLGAILGFALTFPSSSVSTLWPPNAILLASLLLVPSRRWWLVLLGAFPAHLAVQLQSGVPIPMIMSWFVSNCSEALIGAFCLRRFMKGPLDFASLKNIIFYVGFAVILAPFLSSFLDSAFVALVGWRENNYWDIWLTRFRSNALAAIAIPPFAILWFSKGMAWLRRASPRHYIEGFLLISGLLAVSLWVFRWEMPGPRTTPVLLYIPLPFLLWAAMRFGSLGASTSLLLVVLASIWGAAQGRGPFAQSSPAENVLALQMFLIAISLPVMFLAGLVEERREEAKVLSESEARFRSMADTAPVLIWMSGTDRLCSFFNKGWLDFTGRRLEHELGNGWLESVHPEDHDRCLEVYTSAFDARREFAMEYRLRRSDGEYRSVLDKGVPRFSPGGTFLGYIGTCTDITDVNRAQAELLLQRQELAHVSRVSTMGEMAASLAHELNQPLTAILSNAQAAQRFLAASPANFAEMDEILKDIVKDDSRAGEIIRRIRTLVKKEQLEFAPLDLGNIIRDILLLSHSDAILHNIRVSLEIDPGLPPVRGDKVQLQQVMLNLLLNAFDAMNDCPANEREIKLRAEPEGARMVRVTVSDRGTGLSGDTLERILIFQPFYSTKANGLGMGLSISRSIIDAHGGNLWAENNPDRGATFYFTVPVDAARF